MKATKIADLKIDTELQFYICHKSGEVMHNPGDVLKLANLKIMEDCNINEVILLNKDENPDLVRIKAQQKIINIRDITPGDVCPVTLCNKGKEVVIESNSVIDEKQLADLEKNGIKQLYYTKDMQELESFQFNKYKALLDSEVYESIGQIYALKHPGEKDEEKEAVKKDSKININSIHISKSEMYLNPSMEVSSGNVKKGIKNIADLRKKILQPSIYQLLIRSTEQRDDSIKRNAIEKYNKWMNILLNIFNKLKTNHEIPFESIDALTKDIFKLYTEDSYFCLALINMRLDPTSEQYVVSHCVNVCIISIGIASITGYNPQQILEIAIGALMHDVGHVLTYRPLFSTDKLDPSEQVKFDQHAILGVALLKNITRVPKSTPYIVCQHHEYINGRGRVLRCLGENIHDYAKLVAVADMFDIACLKKTQFQAISGIIVQGKSQILDMQFVKSLLLTFSLFPIGSLVLITGNFICKVIGCNGSNYKQPIVSKICTIKNGQIFEITDQESINLATSKDIKIIKEISHPLLNKKIAKGF
jgi:putative nucleotidyltransferase with HDIG domain